uniref:Uncharacterized protein n=1 Tax=Romanomermis culicivorax TaxID=13658 RepID=A0A915IME7_ROMCU
MPAKMMLMRLIDHLGWVDKKHGQKTAASLRVKKKGRCFGGGVDAVGGSSLSINEVEAPSTKMSSKIGKVSKAQSSFRKQNPNFNRSFGPMGAPLKVSLLEIDRRSTKNDSVFGKMGSSKTSQSRTSQSKTSQSKTSKKVG